jgi:SEC-C motif-containing protein
MRSRYSAFARGLGAYLVDTLASSHPDRGRPPADLARELGRAHLTQRYTGLTIFPARPDEVLFHARIFVQGRDHSFVELSTFVREAHGWRYAAGEMLPAKALGSALDSLTREGFLTHLKRG